MTFIVTFAKNQYRGICYLTFEKLGDIDADGYEEDRKNVAEQVPGVAPVKIITISLVYIQCFKTCIITHSSDANRARTNSFNNDSNRAFLFLTVHCTVMYEILRC